MSEGNRERDRQKEIERKEKRRKALKGYSQYYGMAFQIFGLLAIAVLIGMQVDKFMGNETNYVAVFLAFIVLVAYFYKLIIMSANK